MKFDLTKDEDLRKAFLNIITLGSKDNTYKFAMARFLLDYSRDHDVQETKVTFETIAGYFLSYYWPQICKLKIKHAPQTNKKPVIVKIIEKEFPKPYYPKSFKEISEQEPEKIEKCINQIVKKCFHNVTWRFQKINVGKAVESKIFFDYKISRVKHENKKYVDLQYGINVNEQAMQFFRKYNAVLLKLVVLEWSKFLENLNVGLPRLIQKIEGDEVKRGNLMKFKKVLKDDCKNCFYCEKPLDGTTDIHVEHVIPFDYIAEDDIWNLVLACQSCNCIKLGALPPSKFITKLVKRNSDPERISGLEESLLQFGIEFKTLVCKHYENAKLQGYGVLEENFYK